MLTVTCINGLMEGSVVTPRGDQCQGLGVSIAQELPELKIFTLTVTQHAVANNAVTYLLCRCFCPTYSLRCSRYDHLSS